jgi:GMP synthase (glutamine-hydrolysing)
VDNLSPFTPNIQRCLDDLRVDHVRIEYSKIATSDLINSSNVILSGRRKNSKEINSANSRIIRHCYENKKPLLGICYGAEIIALTLGGTIRRMPEHVQGQTSIKIGKKNPLTMERTDMSVYESHAFCVARLPKEFITLASSDSCQNEMFSHASNPIFGTQFHPEKSGSDGNVVIHSFVEIRQERFYLQEKKT